LQQLLRRVAARMAEGHAERVAAKPLLDRVQRTAEALREFGSSVEIERQGQGDELLIRQRTCPYPQVAKLHSAICTLEVGFVQRMTGSDARLISSLLRGDAACTYRVRADGAR
jgi:DeoR family transcriptional regulator, suf operon transcriptional repressor